MKKIYKKIIICLMTVALCIQGISVNAEENHFSERITETARGLKKLTGSDKKYVLSDQKLLPAGNSISDWIAITLAFSGEKDAYGDYLNRLEEYVTACYKEKGSLSEVEATVYQKCVLTILALGGDPLAFGKATEGNAINILADGTYDFKGNNLGDQGITGYIYALLALDAKAYPVPEDAKYNREEILQEILSAQSQTGGFSLNGSGNDVDITAMALQALAPYREQPKVENAIQKALEWLSGEMTIYGTFVSGTAESCESTAQVVLAMCALDILEDSRFQKNGISLLDGLQQFRLADGTYVHTLEESKGNVIATQQALLALEAIQRRENQDRWILDYREYELSQEQCANRNTGFSMAVGAGIIVLIVGGIILTGKKGNRKCIKKQ